MVHCPDCDATFTDETSVEFHEIDAQTNFFAASKRFYLVACEECGAAIGSGVAGAKT